MTNPVSGPAAWMPPESATRSETAPAAGKRSVPPPISPGGTGQIYTSSYLSPHQPDTPEPAPAYRPGSGYQSGVSHPASAPLFEGYGSYEPAPYVSPPYDAGQQAYATAPGYGGYPGSESAEGLDPYYGSRYDQQPYDQQPYGDAYPTPAAGYGSNSRDDDDDSLRQRLPGTAVLAAACVVLLLVCLTLIAMYVGQSGKASKSADELSEAQADVRQRDTKIEGLNTALTEAEQKLGSDTDRLTNSQTELQQLKTEMEKIKKDLEASNNDKTQLNKDKESLASCLRALTAASGESDPAKRAQLAERSQQDCARGFELAGIQTG